MHQNSQSHNTESKKIQPLENMPFLLVYVTLYVIAHIFFLLLLLLFNFFFQETLHKTFYVAMQLVDRINSKKKTIQKKIKKQICLIRKTT